MDANTYARVRPMYDEAMQLPPAERTHWVRSHCAGDNLLADAVIALLAAAQDAGNRFDSGAWRVPVDPVPPRIGPYEVMEEIGSGGMGKVYLARRADGSFDRRVAIKLIKEEMKRDGIVERFLQERNILAALQHPNIAALYDAGTTPNGDNYLVMEYVAGKRLDAFCDQSKASLAARLNIFYTICYAVEYLHSQGVTHRDLKPSNILVNAFGNPKILDFGIAKPAPGGLPGLTSVLNAPAGFTLEYASPEQMQFMPVSHRSDIYSLGVILFLIITGRRPFVDHESSIPAMLSRILQHPLPEPSRFLPPDDAASPLVLRLDPIVLRCLAIDPQGRFTSAAELAEAVKRACLEPVPPAAPPELPVEPVVTPPTNATVSPGRSRLIKSLAAAALLPLLFLLPSQKSQPQVPAVPETTPVEDGQVQVPSTTASARKKTAVRTEAISSGVETQQEPPLPEQQKPTESPSRPQDPEFLNRHTQLQAALQGVHTTLQEYQVTRTTSVPLRGECLSFLFVAKQKAEQAEQLAQSGDSETAWKLLREAEGNVNAARKLLGG